MAILAYTILILIGAINTIHIGLYIVGANLYDMRRFGKSKTVPRRFRHPLVSIVVPAHNEELVIERCLESIRKNTHRKLEVIVHNDLSTDSTRRIVTAYKLKYPKFNLRLVNRRHQVGKAGGVNYCMKRYAKGELVMTLDADCVLRRDAIKNAISYFVDPKLVGLAANVRIMDRSTVLGVLQKFEHMIGYRSKKFYTIANCEFIVGGVASTYRRTTIQQVKYYDTDTTTEDIGLSMKIAALGNRENRIAYAADVVAMTEGAQTLSALMKQRYRWKMGCLQNLLKHAHLIGKTDAQYSKSLTWYRMPMAFFSELLLMVQPFMVAYVVAVTVIYRTPILVIGAYGVITSYALLTIWMDEHASVRSRLTMSLYAPVLYFIFYIMDTIQVISIVRCLTHPKQLARNNKTYKGTWISPSRVGQTVEFS